MLDLSLLRIMKYRKEFNQLYPGIPRAALVSQSLIALVQLFDFNGHGAISYWPSSVLPAVLVVAVALSPVRTVELRPAAFAALSFWLCRAAVAASVTGLVTSALGTGATSGVLAPPPPNDMIIPLFPARCAGFAAYT